MSPHRHRKPKENPVHYPPDRRLVVWLRRRALLLGIVLVALPILGAWAQVLISGWPAVTPPAPSSPADGPPGFPGWLRLTHFANFFFLVLLMRSGLSILMDHPRLYWNDHCTPGSEWLRFTPVGVPADRLWTAKDDARYVSPWLALPGYRHTIGMARHWHLLGALFFVLNGAAFLTLLLATDHWKRLVPRSWDVLPQAWSTFVHYATLHLPPESDPAHHFNALQQLTYFGVVFVMAPLSFLTGLAMSPALNSRFPWYPRLFGGPQAARSIHFLLLVGYVVFLIGHVTLVAATGFLRNMNHIVLGVSSSKWHGAWLGLAAIALVIAACFAAHWAAWKHPRALQLLVRRIHGLIRRLLFHRLEPRARYSAADVSPFFWPNGKLPVSEEWRALSSSGYRDYRLRVGGLVAHPLSLSLAELKALGRQEQITMHHCIQGWSGVASWGGLPMRALMERARPLPEARVCVFHSFGEGLYGGPYYDTQPIDNLRHEQCILAYEMNGQPLPDVYGAPLRLRVENQLGYKMVKWIRSIEFVQTEKSVGLGHGGKNEDDEYFDLLPEI